MIKHTKDAKKPRKVNLKAVADRVGLAAGTVSTILNRTPQSSALPQRTRDRVFAAARELNYQPNFFARALRMGKAPTAPANGSDLGRDTGAFMIVGAEHVRRAIHAMREAGLRVPEDVSVVGFENVPGGTAAGGGPLVSRLATMESQLESG
jgi:DNA-binding LacI/PurR family transcriptional regulator